MGERRNRSVLPTDALGQAMASHDFQEAGMIGKAEGFGSPGYLPAMLVEGGENDFPFGLRLQRLQGSRSRGRVGVVAPASLDFWWRIEGIDDVGIGRNHHALQTVSKFANIVLPPVVRCQQSESLRRDGLRPHAKV